MTAKKTKKKLPPITMSATAVLQLLATKHQGDVFVSECKSGPTQTANARPFRLDAWVMPRSWAHDACTGYEIKVTRADFLKDNKWQQYLDCCNLFYFVAPAGVIEKGEIPEPAGLLQVGKACRGFRTIKKAPFRDIKIPEELWRYVMMSRVKITPPHMNQRLDKADYWRAWMTNQVVDAEFGGKVSRAIGHRVREEVLKVRAEVDVMEIKMRPFKDAKKVLDAMGISLSKWDSARQIEQRLLAKLQAKLPVGLRESLVSSEGHLSRAILRLDEFEESQRSKAARQSKENGDDE